MQNNLCQFIEGYSQAERYGMSGHHSYSYSVMSSRVVRHECPPELQLVSVMSQPMATPVTVTVSVMSQPMVKSAVRRCAEPLSGVMTRGVQFCMRTEQQCTVSPSVARVGGLLIFLHNSRS